MVLLKVLILAKVVIASGIKNETSGKQQLSEIQKAEVKIYFNDTTRLTEKDFVVVENSKISIGIKITDSLKFKRIYGSKNQVIAIHYKDTLWIAKGNENFKSSVPQDCDLFYPLTFAGFPMFQKGRIRFTKLSGMVPVEYYH